MKEFWHDCVHKRVEYESKIREIKRDYFWSVIEFYCGKQDEYVINKDVYFQIMEKLRMMWGNKMLRTILEELKIPCEMRGKNTVIKDIRDKECNWESISGVEETDIVKN